MTERKPLLAFTRRQILNVQPNGYKLAKKQMRLESNSSLSPTTNTNDVYEKLFQFRNDLSE